MPEVEIQRVEGATLDPSRFLGGSIDRPRAGERWPHYLVRIEGWVAPRDGEPVEVVVSHHGAEVARWPVDRQRPDVSAALGDLGVGACGFGGALRALELPRDFVLEVHAVGERGRSHLGTLRGRRSALPQPTPGTPSPVFVTTLGRTGSTLLLHFLRQHPDLVVHPPFPYETRVAGHWAAVVDGLSTPESYLRALVADDGLDRRRWAGSEPFPVETYADLGPAAQRLGGESIEKLIDHARDQVADFYRVSAAQEAKAGLCRFVEKRLPEPRLRRLLAELYPDAREVFLLRDPRDVLASILAWNRKRGLVAFGREVCASDEEYVEQLGGAFAELLDAHARNPEGLLVRYESLVRDPEGTLTAVLEHLGVARDPATVAELLRRARQIEGAAQASHRTSGDALASIGRWREDLSPALQEACRHLFEATLAASGDPGPIPSPPAAPRLPLPPPEMRALVGPLEDELFDNRSGEPVFPELDAALYDFVLDWGCGCGRIARQLLQQRPRPRRYLGVDLHRGMIEWCRRNLAPHAPGFDFVHQDVYNRGLNPTGVAPWLPLPVDGGAVSLVIAWSVFTHTNEAAATFYLRELARVLRPDGAAVTTWFLFDKGDFPMMQTFQNALYINTDDPSNAVVFDRGWLRETARRNGLVLSRIGAPSLYGFQWRVTLRPAACGDAEAPFPADTAPRGRRAPPLLPPSAPTLGLAADDETGDGG